VEGFPYFSSYLTQKANVMDPITLHEKREDKVTLWKLVDRKSNTVYQDNMSYTEGEKLLHSSKKYRDNLGNYKLMTNKMLIPVDYKFSNHSTMGNIWA